jgi:carboxylesterase
MVKTDWHDWYRACVENLAELSAECDKVFLCGMSMGGTLSLHMAAHYADRFNIAGVAAYAAPIYLRHFLLPLLPAVKRFMKYKPSAGSDVADPVACQEQQSYDRTPFECIISLLELLDHVRNDLQDISVPVLLMQSTGDNTVHPQNVHFIHGLLGSRDKTVVELERSYHVITVDYDRELVKEKTFEFIDRVGRRE